MALSADSATVLYLDYGNVNKVSFEGIRRINDMCSTFPIQSVKCSLFGVEELIREVPSDLLLHTFVAVATDDSRVAVLKAVIKKKINMTLSLNILDPVTNSSTLSVLQEKLGQPQKSVAPKAELSTTQKLQSIVLPLGEKITVICFHFANIDDLYLQICNDEVQGTFQKEQARINDPALNLMGSAEYSPAVGELVAVEYEGEFSRAKVISIQDTDYQVYFIDYGNTELVSCTKIRKLDPTFQCLPSQCVKCRLAGMDQNALSVTVQDLRSKISMVKTTAKALSFASGTYNIELWLADGTFVNDSFHAASPVVAANASSPVVAANVNDGHLYNNIIEMTHMVPQEDQFQCIITAITTPSSFFCTLADRAGEYL